MLGQLTSGRHSYFRAHARAYRAYHKDFAATQVKQTILNQKNTIKFQGGQIGITLNINWMEPRDPTSEDDIAASRTKATCIS